MRKTSNRNVQGHAGAKRELGNHGLQYGTNEVDVLGRRTVAVGAGASKRKRRAGEHQADGLVDAGDRVTAVGPEHGSQARRVAEHDEAAVDLVQLGLGLAREAPDAALVGDALDNATRLEGLLNPSCGARHGLVWNAVLSDRRDLVEFLLREPGCSCSDSVHLGVFDLAIAGLEVHVSDRLPQGHLAG